jgi:hypothetical protein
MGGTQNRTIAAKDDGQIGFNAGDIFLAAEIFADDLGVLRDDRAKPSNLFQKVGSLARAQEDDAKSLVARKGDRFWRRMCHVLSNSVQLVNRDEV